MQTNYHFLSHYAPYLEKQLKGFVLESCFSQDKDELLLEFSKNEQYKFLRIRLKPNQSDVFLLEEYARARKNTFDLWTEFYGLQIHQIKVGNWERAIILELSNGVVFVVKFFGNRPNLLLFDANEPTPKYVFNNQLIADKTMVLEDFSKTFEPSKQAFIDSEGNINLGFPTFGKNIRTYIESQTENNSLETKYSYCLNILNELEKPNFYILKTQHQVYLCLLPTAEVLFSSQDPQEALKYYFQYYYSIQVFFEAQQKSINQAKQQAQKLENYIFEKEHALQLLKNGTSKEEIGHILMANIHTLKGESEKVELFDFYRNQTIEITLKKNLSAVKNAEWYYRKAKNEKIEIDIAEKNLLAAHDRKKELQSKIEKLLNASSFKDIKGLEPPKKTNSSAEEDSLFKVFHHNGHEILVGKNAKNNDLLTLKHCKKDDYWLHAKDCTGSHVVVRKKNNFNLPKDVIEYAASLAAYFSKRKTDSLVPVTFTQKKFVRKTKGLPDGAVVVDKESVVFVKPELR
ncbi:MAG: NFACT RNA binding domain-containing protein [Leadbetterella sp.]